MVPLPKERMFLMQTVTSTSDRAVSTARGTMRADVSRQWASRPDDEKFLSLDDLGRHVKARRDRSATDFPKVKEIVFDFDPEADELGMDVEGRLIPFSNWSFGQTCRAVGAPANFLTKLPAELATMNLQTMALMSGDFEQQRYMDASKDPRLIALTGPKYGRIYDQEVVDTVREMTRNSDVKWKVPGVMNWGTGRYDPSAPVSKDTTTLFASDRDVFMFLCADQDPIEVGKLPNGDPDLMFRGFIVSNSEVGARQLYVATMYLRAVCANRCLWGVEQFREIKIRHSQFAPDRFRDDVLPALESYTHGDAKRVVEGVELARSARVADASDEETQVKFLTDRLDFSEVEAKRIIGSATNCEQHPPATVWDFAQGITAYAQTVPHHDKRFGYEVRAGQLLDGVLAN